MSDPKDEKEPTYVQMTDSHLRKIFDEAKSRNQSQTDFENNKTQRIIALCDAMKTSKDVERRELFQFLRTQIESQYIQFDWH